MFEARLKVEKFMNRRELVAYDKLLLGVLTHSNLIERLKYEIKKEESLF
jgi:hypothetical protein